MVLMMVFGVASANQLSKQAQKVKNEHSKLKKFMAEQNRSPGCLT